MPMAWLLERNKTCCLDFENALSTPDFKPSKMSQDKFDDLLEWDDKQEAYATARGWAIPGALGTGRRFK
jgi:hypothetical protein